MNDGVPRVQALKLANQLAKALYVLERNPARLDAKSNMREKEIPAVPHQKDGRKSASAIHFSENM